LADRHGNRDALALLVAATRNALVDALQSIDLSITLAAETVGSRKWTV
jgi:hypothetical protein